MTTKTVLITDYQWADIDIEREVLEGMNILVAETGNEDELIQLASQADAILTCWKPVTAKVLDVATKCKIIKRYGVGLDNIDVAYATDLGIVVTNVPDYCIEEVSDHVFALLFAWARKIVTYDRSMRGGDWDLSIGTPMFRMRGKTLGIVGYGNTGRLVAEKAKAFGLNVLAYHPRLPEGTDGIVTHDLEQMLSQSDFVTVHVPLKDETRNMVNADFLSTMKSSAFLINTARGGVLDEDALLNALNNNVIAGAALDVLVEEPSPPSHPLRQHDKVIITPHAAFTSVESIQDLQRKSAEHVKIALNGEQPPFIVNATVLRQDNCRLR